MVRVDRTEAVELVSDSTSGRGLEYWNRKADLDQPQSRGRRFERMADAQAKSGLKIDLAKTL